MELKWGVAVDVPESELPGFYEQIDKAFAGWASLFDCDKELLVLSFEEEQLEALDVADECRIPAEPLALLLLPETAAITPLFSDYGFTSRRGRRYLYADQVRIFKFMDVSDHNKTIDREPANGDSSRQAVLQMQEHLLARFPGAGGQPLYAVDSKLEPLMTGIARAYRCSIEFVR